MNTILKPKALKEGDTIGIISPASPQRDPERLQRGISYLEQKGFAVKLGDSALASYAGYLAGTDQERIHDLEFMFSDTSVDAIFCARGGYGTARMLPYINYDVIAAHPKIFVGFSDTTALQCAIFKKTGLITFSGAMPSVDMADSIDPFTESSLWDILMNTSEKRSIPTQDSFSIQSGYAEGRLICGNLCLIASLCGSEYLPEFNNTILLLEDIGEEQYKIDRLLCQLNLNGILSKTNGLLFGQFTPPNNPITSVPQRDYLDILTEYSINMNKPSLANIDYGHIAKKLTLPFGINISIDADTKEIILLESPLCS